ncbi:hypothetical protein TNCV_3966571 [Trichonephila clavipes]|nr:hypothetical protein TNCV_3966571 [Trichonephila clavipes]
MIITSSNINTRENIFNGSIQLLAFDDDIDIIARTPTALKQAFLSLEKEDLRIKMKRGEEDQISSSITHIKNMTSLTSKYNELNGQITLSEWTNTTPLKKSLMPNQLAHGKKAGQI